LQEWVAEISQRRFGRNLRVGDAFSGMGSIPFAAAELGCDVYASDLNPVACLLTWGALSIIAGQPEFHARVLAAQQETHRNLGGNMQSRARIGNGPRPLRFRERAKRKSSFDLRGRRRDGKDDAWTVGF
jgi:hypothetical protein